METGFNGNGFPYAKEGGEGGEGGRGGGEGVHHPKPRHGPPLTSASSISRRAIRSSMLSSLASKLWITAEEMGSALASSPPAPPPSAGADRSFSSAMARLRSNIGRICSSPKQNTKTTKVVLLLTGFRKIMQKTMYKKMQKLYIGY